MDDVGYGDVGFDDEVYIDMGGCEQDEFQQFLHDDMCEDLMKDDDDFAASSVSATGPDVKIQQVSTSSCPSGTVWKSGDNDNIACWWCCHSFKTTPISLPTNYDSHRNRWTFYGIFCGPSCAKSFSADSMHGGDMGLKAAWLTKCLKQVYKLEPPFRCAPPRQCLKMFGGTMTISQFRKNSKFCTWTVSMPPFDPQISAVYGTMKQPSRKKCSSKSTTESTIRSQAAPVTSLASTPSENTLKLKRKKTDAKKSCILDSMQITTRTKR